MHLFFSLPGGARTSWRTGEGGLCWPQRRPCETNIIAHIYIGTHTRTRAIVCKLQLFVSLLCRVLGGSSKSNHPHFLSGSILFFPVGEGNLHPSVRTPPSIHARVSIHISCWEGITLCRSLNGGDPGWSPRLLPTPARSISPLSFSVFPYSWEHRHSLFPLWLSSSLRLLQPKPQ